MEKNVWILNHYATAMYYDHGDRHYWFADNLMKKGYSPTIFCASTVHNSSEVIDTGDGLFLEQKANGIPFVFVKTSSYKGNSTDRMKNVLLFYINLQRVAKQYASQCGNPDVIIASSGHPLTAIAGIKIAKKMNVPCIVEVRDLQPESAIAYGLINRKNPLTKILYQGEKWIYKKADSLIFTMEGGKEYLKERKWTRIIDLNKVYHINNGLDIEQFDYNAQMFELNDPDLNNNEKFKIIYTGSIRRANNIVLLIDAIKYADKNAESNIQLLIYGEGNERKLLEEKCTKEKIENVIFKGRIEKKFIPGILMKSDLNILNYSQHSIWRYGGSQRKLFEYLASGKPILSTITMGYDLITKHQAGVSLASQTAETIGKAMIDFSKMSEEQYNEMGSNARKLAKEYDFTKLTENLIEVIENL